VTFHLDPKYLYLAAPTVTWDFGDGSPTVSAPKADSVQHTFTHLDIFRVWLTLSSTHESEYCDLAVGYGEIRYSPITVEEPNDAVITLTRKTAVASATIHYQTFDGTAKAGQRYVAASGDFTFTVGETSKSVSIKLIGDSVYEDDQSFEVRFTGGRSDGYFLVGQGSVTIKDDDPPPTFAFTAKEFTALESDGHVTATVRRTGDLLRTVSVRVGVGSAWPYWPVIHGGGGNLTFAPGEITKTIDIAIANDNLYEGKSTADIGIFVDSPARTIAPAQATLVIADDDSPPTIAVNNLRVQEGDYGTVSGRFVLTLSRPVVQGWMTLEMVDGTAHNADYRASSETYQLNNGVTFNTSFTYDVQALGNDRVQPDRTATLRVTAPFPFSQPGATFTIVDDDVDLFPDTLTLRIDSPAPLKVSFGQPQPVDRTVTVTTTDVTAPAAVSVPAGATSFSIPVTGKTAGAGLVKISFPPEMFTREIRVHANVSATAVAVPHPSSVAVVVGHAADVEVSIEPSQPMPVDVRLSVTDPGVADAPALVTVPAGGSASAQVRGLAEGSTTMAMTVSGTTTVVPIRVMAPTVAPRRRAARP